MSSEFMKLLSSNSFYETIENGFTSLSVPLSNNSILLENVVVFHAQTDTLVFALMSGIFFALVSWVLSLITGLHTWVRISRQGF